MRINLAAPGFDLLVTNAFVGVLIGLVFSSEFLKLCGSAFGSRRCRLVSFTK